MKGKSGVPFQTTKGLDLNRPRPLEKTSKRELKLTSAES